MDIKQLRVRAAEIKVELADWAKRDKLTDADQAAVQGLLDEFDAANRSIKLHELREGVGDGSLRTEDGDGAGKPFQASKNRVGDPWQNTGASIRDRALAAAELMDVPDVGDADATRNKLTKVLEGPSNSEFGNHLVTETTNPDYVSAFAKRMTGREIELTDKERAAVGRVATLERALNEGSGAAGQFLVPAHLDPSVIVTNVGTRNPFRQIARTVTVNTQAWKGVSSAGVTAEWVAEAAEATDASPTFAQPTITPVRADAYVQASWEVLQDQPAISNEIVRLLVDAKDNLEGTAFAVGTGSTQPFGIVSALQLTTASRVAGTSGAAGAADFVVADVYALDNALPARYYASAAWVGHQAIVNKIRQFATGSGPQHAFWADLGANVPPTLLGHPVHVSSDMDSTIVSGSNDDVLILGDFSQYVIVDRIGMSVASTPWVIGTNRRPTGETGFYAFWRVGADSINDDGFRMLRL